MALNYSAVYWLDKNKTKHTISAMYRYKNGEGRSTVWTNNGDELTPTDSKYFVFNLLDDDTYEILAADETHLYNGLPEIVLPSTYNGKPVTQIRQFGFRGTMDNPSSGVLTKIHIPKSITTIGQQAFIGQGNLTEVTIADDSNLSIIGSAAFYLCSSLTSFKLPDSVYGVASLAFAGCDSLTRFEIGVNSSLEIIQGNAITNCQLSNIYIPASVTTMDRAAIWNQYSKPITFYCNADSKPEGWDDEWCKEGDKVVWGYKPTDESYFRFTKLEDGTYSVEAKNTSNLPSEIGIPWEYKGIAVTSIGEWAFVGCSSLTSIVIPDSITSIGYNTFYNCTSLTSVVIGDSVTSIDNYTFEGCSSLTSVVIGDSVTTIGDGAFYGCSSLTSVVIPDSVKTIDWNVFNGCTNLTSITIPDSVTSIGDNAFYDCTSLNSVYISDLSSWFNISFSNDFSNPFSYATNLYLKGELVTKLEIPNNVTSIGRRAFYNCTNITDVVIPDSVTSIGNEAFWNCSSLTSIVIPDSVTSIGDSVFGYCTSLIDIVIPNSVTFISNQMFHNCSSLTNVTIPDSVTSIGNSAFFGCSGLTSITIPDSVTSIGWHAFYDCSNLTICCEVASKPSGWASNWNSSNCPVVWNCFLIDDYFSYTELSDGTYSIAARDVNNLSGELQIPSEFKGKAVTSINGFAFRNCSSLTSVVIPDSVTTIGSSAFNGCTSLTSVTIPDRVISIGISAFQGCTSLISIVIPDSVTSVGEQAFYNCRSLTSIVIPNSVTSIGERAFRDCYNLTDVTIGDSVISIGNEAFSNCTSLQNVHITNIANWCNISFGASSANPLHCAKNLYINSEFVTELVIPNSVTTISDYAFFEYSKLTSVVIPNSVTTIGYMAFYNCSSLTSIVIGDSVTSIGRYAFWNCTSLYIVYNYSNLLIEMGSTNNGEIARYTKMLIDNGVTSYLNDGYDYTLTDDGFLFRYKNSKHELIAYAGGKDTVTLPANINGNSYVPHSMCGVVNVIIPEGFTAVSSNAFRYCYSLTDVVISNSVISIDNCAFYGCSNLQSVEIPDSVTTISSEAFCDCSNLTSVAMPNSVASIGSWAFDKCSNLQSVEIPNSVTAIGGNAFLGCSNLTIYCEATEQPSGWNSNWNPDNRPVVWGYTG